MLIVLVPYWNILLRHQSLVPSANYHPFDQPYRHLKMGELAVSPVLNWYDLGGTWWMWEPAAKWFSKAFRAGSIPLWDPSIAGGIDAHVTVTNGQYFPPYTLLLLLGDTPLQRDLYSLMLLALAAFCCYRLGRRWQFHVIPSLVFAACFVWSGALTLNVNSILGQATAMLPLMVLAVDWLADRPTGFRIGASALVLACSALSSFLPIVVFGYVLCGFLILVRAFADPAAPGTRPRTAVIHIAAFSAAALLSIGTIAFLLLPVHYASAASPVFNRWYRSTGLEYISFDYLFTLVSPTLTYNVLGMHDVRGDLFPEPPPPWCVGFFYFGLTPLLLLTLLRRGSTPRQRIAIVFCAVSAAFFLLKLLGIPPAQWIGYLPVFRHMHFRPYACGALTLALSGLAAASVESLLRHRPSVGRISALAAALLAFSLLLVAFVQTHPVNSSTETALLLRAAIRHGLETLRLGLVAGALLLIIILRRYRLPAAVAGWLVLAVIALELVPPAFRIRFERTDVWTGPPQYVRFLQSDHSLFRIHGVHSLALTPNVFEGLGLSGISARAPFTPERYTTLIRSYFKTEPLPYPLPSELLPSTRGILDLLNVKYLITYEAPAEALGNLQQAGLQPVDSDGPYRVFRNPTAWPRAFIPESFELVPDARAALAAVGRLPGPGRVVLEEKPAAIPASGSGGTAEIALYEPDRVSIRTRSANPALLVLLDNAAPGWTALVNGAPARILTADYAFRAVEVPAGSAQVDFRYTTPGLRAGLAITALSTLFCAFLMTPFIRRIYSRFHPGVARI